MRIGDSLSTLSKEELTEFLSKASCVVNGGIDSSNFYDDGSDVAQLDCSKVMDLPISERAITGDKMLLQTIARGEPPIDNEIIDFITERISYPYNLKTVSIPLSLDENNAFSENPQAPTEFSLNALGSALTTYGIGMSPLTGALPSGVRQIAQGVAPQAGHLRQCGQLFDGRGFLRNRLTGCLMIIM